LLDSLRWLSSSPISNPLSDSHIAVLERSIPHRKRKLLSPRSAIIQLLGSEPTQVLGYAILFPWPSRSTRMAFLKSPLFVSIHLATLFVGISNNKRPRRSGANNEEALCL
jgi:hypothetical protein